ncbi:MAG: Neelaredoxin [Candidatus Omnitrophica bacterium]|nr:Neelaredoxin [Candidatus Omnitrophota bacterium]MBD3268748.1 Neelaredoxin [Candidatus Omnitrophota bacterium]
MSEFKDLYQQADWKTEKHVPVIEAPDKVKKGDFFKLDVSTGKEVSHPNKTEHHIRWISVFFKPEDEKFPYQIGKVEFTAHGESVQGSDTSSVYTHHQASMYFKTEKSGTIYASAYCNIHGLWSSSKELEIEQ